MGSGEPGRSMSAMHLFQRTTAGLTAKQSAGSLSIGAQGRGAGERSPLEGCALQEARSGASVTVVITSCDAFALTWGWRGHDAAPVPAQVRLAVSWLRRHHPSFQVDTGPVKLIGSMPESAARRLSARFPHFA